jgi:hypothetical protein
MPIYQVACQGCGRTYERISTIASRRAPCDCGGEVDLVPCSSVTHKPFIAYDDFALGAHVTSHAERNRLMREGHLEYREKIGKGELSARRDRAEQERRSTT